MPYVIPSSVLHADAPGPNDRIGMAAIGIGRQGGGLANGLAKSGLGHRYLPGP